MKTKHKVSLCGILIILAAMLCTSFLLAFPKTTHKATALNSSQENALNYLKKFTPLEYYNGIFEEKTYAEVYSNNIVVFNSRFISLFNYSDYIAGNIDISKLDTSEENKQMLQNKYNIIDNLNTELNIYLNAVYLECQNFKTEATNKENFDYDNINNLTDNEKTLIENNITKFKAFYAKFWEENSIFLTYAENAQKENSLTTAITLVNAGKANLENCLNKIVALRESVTKLSEFKERIDALPPILKVTKANEEQLNKLKTDLDNYYSTYAVHLGDDDKKTIENYQWKVNKSLERINKSESNWAIFWVALIVAGIAGVVMLLKYFVFPLLKKKRGRRK